MKMFERNQGVISASEQETLANAHVAILGLGGLGGPISEVLTRSGVGHLTLVDFDTFDESNLNRQIYAFQDTLGRPKTEVTAEVLRRINPQIQIHTADTVTEANAAEVLTGCGLIVLAADDIVPCIAAARFARSHGVPVVEGWAIPFCNVRVFLPDSPTLEACYAMEHLPEPLGELDATTRAQLNQQMLGAIARIDGVMDHYAPNVLELIQAGQIPAFAPMVWFAATRMAIEVVKLLLGRGTLSVSPEVALYDPFEHRFPEQR